MMPFDPQKLFLGIMDLFTIIMPGALLTFLLRDHVGTPVLGDSYDDLGGAEAWALFLLASYLVGHVVFLIGASLDEPYDWLRRRTLGAQTERLGRSGRLVPYPIRILASVVFKNEENRAVEAATALRQQMLAPVGAGSSINTFQWSKAWLTIEQPSSLSTVQRFEADSKFFRSFSVVVAILIVVVAWRGDAVLWPRWSVVPLVALLGGSLWRYMELRLKSTNQAYWSVLTLAAGKGVEVAPPVVADAMSPVGGVVLRNTKKRGLECLLVGSDDGPERRVLPNGTVRPGEQARVAAVRHVREQTGQWAGIKGGVPGSGWFVMEPLGRAPRADRSRRVEWMAVGDLDGDGGQTSVDPDTVAVVRAAAAVWTPDGGEGMTSAASG